jgi:flagellar assembly factor FliW
MTTTLQSTRFGEIEVLADDIIEFPLGLIGLGGSRYARLDTNPGSNFFWLHSLDDPALALPIVDPRLFFSQFALHVAREDRERIEGDRDLADAQVYVTVRTAPDPADIVVNLRAPLVVLDGRGYQVLNMAPDAELRVPLFAPSGPTGGHGVVGAGGGAPVADAA